ncbi:MAG TPA: efflux RND transporter periplasmic adaptor subunit [Lysobacter sp.]|jgi:membrane fusion protein (multidrug efflux system)|nr:efflux RND transporter periplasmic adaptor subunit [Lysobacter sp.]
MRQTPYRSVSAILTCVLLTGLLALSACKGGGNGSAEANDKKEKKGPEAVPVEVAQASRRAVAASYTGTAPLEARADAQVIAKVSGVALQVLVEEGQYVHAGQTLVRLDSARTELMAAQSAAQMHKLEANYARAKQMAEQKLISANDNDQLRYDLENARAAYKAANLELAYANVTAPISGVIASRSIKTGNFVQINTPIMRIVDVSRLEAVLNVPERELVTLKAGLPVQLAVDALPGKGFTGTVDRVAPVVDSGSGTFRVVCSFADGNELRPGMFGRLKIDYDQRADALVVPRAALLEDESDPAVFVVRKNKSTRVPVKLGYLDGEWAEVRSGIKQGDQVVIAGKSALRDGTEVQVIGQPGAKSQVAASETATAKQ